MRKLLKENYRNLLEREEQEQRERTPEGGSQKCENWNKKNEENLPERSSSRREGGIGKKKKKLTRSPKMRKLE